MLFTERIDTESFPQKKNAKISDGHSEYACDTHVSVSLVTSHTDYIRICKRFQRQRLNQDPISCDAYATAENLESHQEDQQILLYLTFSIVIK